MELTLGCRRSFERTRVASVLHGPRGHAPQV